MTAPERPNAEHGDAATAYANEILRTVVGSGVHGIAIEGTDDHDEMGVFIEPPGHIIGLDVSRITRDAQPTEHYVYRTQPEGARSGPGDTDLVIYSLRKFLRLAAKGNPTMLVPLFAPASDVLVATPLGHELRDLGWRVLSRHAVRRFLAYSRAQRDRITGVSSRHGMPNRPELVAAHGFDTKYASHALRLAYQGYEVAQWGRLTLPMHPEERDAVLQVKRGEWPLAQVLDRIDDITGSISEVLSTPGASPLPEYPDLERLNAWSVDAHRRHWGWSDHP